MVVILLLLFLAFSSPGRVVVLVSRLGARMIRCVQRLGQTHLNENKNKETDFLLSSKAFMGMANKGMEHALFKLGLADIEYKRIACDYKGKNLAVRVEESSMKPHYLAIKLLYQGGQTEIVAVDVAQVGSSNWGFLSRNAGAVWKTSRVPAGALQLRLVVTSGYDRKSIWAKRVLPADWNVGLVYDSGVQIQEVAEEGCGRCD